jgi:hypothetical protein
LAVPLADKGVFQAERFGALGNPVCGEIHELGDAAGLSGKAGLLVVHQCDQFGKRR